MRRAVEDIVDAALLDDLACVHDQHLVRHSRHDTKVVGDEDDGHASLALQVAHEVEDLRLDRDVERRRGFVGDEDQWFAGQGHGDHGALQHAAWRTRTGTAGRAWRPPGCGSCRSVRWPGRTPPGGSCPGAPEGSRRSGRRWSSLDSTTSWDPGRSSRPGGRGLSLPSIFFSAMTSTPSSIAVPLVIRPGGMGMRP